MAHKGPKSLSGILPSHDAHNVLSQHTCPDCGMTWEPPNPHASWSHSFCPNCRFPLTQIAGKYQLTRRLGSGSFGDVYMAVHLGLTDNPERVIKVLKPEMFDKPESRLRFQREIRLTSSLSLHNPHIVRVYDDFGEEPKLGYFYVMEYLNGQTLSSLLKDSQPSPSLACHIAMQLCDGMAAAHDARIVHRDLKPDNIYLVQRRDEPYFVKILDFGIAKPLNQHNVEGALTQRHRLLGTPLYMSPEQCLQQPLDGRSDIYSIGIILYELIVGDTPFAHRAGGGLTAMLQAHIQETPVSPRQRRPGLSISKALEDVILRALNKHPEDRYRSVQAMKEALQRTRTEHLATSTIQWERRATSAYGTPAEAYREATPAAVAYINEDPDRKPLPQSPPKVTRVEAPTTQQSSAMDTRPEAPIPPREPGTSNKARLGIALGSILLCVLFAAAWLMQKQKWNNVPQMQSPPPRMGKTPYRPSTQNDQKPSQAPRKTIPTKRGRLKRKPTLRRKRTRQLTRKSRKHKQVRVAPPSRVKRTAAPRLPRGCPTRKGIQWIRIDIRPRGLRPKIRLSGPRVALLENRSWLCVGLRHQSKHSISFSAPGYRPCRLTFTTKRPSFSIRLQEDGNDTLEQGALDYCRLP